MADAKISALPPADNVTPLVRCGVQAGITVQIPGAADLAQTVRDLGYTPGPANLPQNSQSAAYTILATDNVKHIFHPAADATARIWTIDSNANLPFALGTMLTFVNQHGAGIITIAITADTLRMAGTGVTGSRQLAPDGIATAIKIATTEWLISGTGLT